MYFVKVISGTDHFSRALRWVLEFDQEHCLSGGGGSVEWHWNSDEQRPAKQWGCSKDRSLRGEQAEGEPGSSIQTEGAGDHPKKDHHGGPC